MKRALLLLLMICLFFPLSGQIMEQDFESWSFGDWSRYTYGNSSNGWQFTSTAAKGNAAIYHTYYNRNDSDDWLVSPKIKSLPRAYLSFFERNGDMYNYGSSEVYISTGSGDPEEGDFVELYESSKSISQYKQKSIDLSEYVGKDVYIAFRHQGNYYSHSWHIDEIKVGQLYSKNLGIEVLVEQVQINNEIRIKAKVKNLSSAEVSAGQEVKVFLDDKYVTSFRTENTLGFFEEEVIDDTLLSIPQGNYTVKCELRNDNEPANNVAEQQVVLFSSDIVQNNFDKGWVPGYKEWVFDGVDIGYWSEDNSYTAYRSSSEAGTLTTRKLELPDTAMMAFKAKGGWNEQVTVQYYDENLRDWKNIGAPVNFSGDGNWIIHFVDLSELSGKQAKLRLVLEGQWYSNLPRIEELTITGEFVKGVPLPVQSLFPSMGSTDIDISSGNLHWSINPEGAPVDHYKVYMGTDGKGKERPTNIINGGRTEGNNYNYSKLDYNTTYYYQIVPYHYEYGEAKNCPIISFKTMEEQVLEAPFIIDFEDRVKPKEWRDYFYSSSPYNQTNDYFQIYNYRNLFDGSSSLRYYWNYSRNMLSILPKVELGESIHKDYFEFDVAITERYTSKPDTLFNTTDTLALLVSTDGTWSKKNKLYTITSKDSLGEGKHVKIDLDGYSGTVQFAFWVYSDNYTQYYDRTHIFIDNVEVSRVPEEESLNWIKLDDEIFSAFRNGVEDYKVYVAGGSPVPVVKAEAKDPLANVDIQQAAAVPGTAKVTVSAQNSNYKREFNIQFVDTELSKNTNLSELTVNGELIDGFAEAKTNYNYGVEYGTEDKPLIAAVAKDSKARVFIDQPTSMPLGSAIVTVVAEDANYTKTYKVNFVEGEPASNAELSSLLINGIEISGFSPSTSDYTYYISAQDGVLSVPVVTAIAADENSALKVTQTKGVNGMSTVEVTAEDNVTTKTYSIDFSGPSLSAQGAGVENALELYPNPVKDKLKINMQVDNVEVKNITGVTVLNKFNTDLIDLESLTDGYYLVVLSIDGHKILKRILKQ